MFYFKPFCAHCDEPFTNKRILDYLNHDVSPTLSVDPTSGATKHIVLCSECEKKDSEKKKAALKECLNRNKKGGIDMNSGLGKELKELMQKGKEGKLAILIRSDKAVLTQVAVDALDKNPDERLGFTDEADKAIKWLYGIWKSI